MSSALQQRLQWQFRDEHLLREALTHRSYAHERQSGAGSNERLEFLGDAVLNFLCANWLFTQFPAYSEGELTALRSALVRAETLAGFARELHLGELVQISRGEDSPAARARVSLLADLFEALLGALYRDGGLDVVRQFVEPFLAQALTEVLAGRLAVDYRSQLQELLQAERNQTPRYAVTATEGPEHDRRYQLEVYGGDELLGSGWGPSKRAAGHAAAKAALIMLGKLPAEPTTE